MATFEEADRFLQEQETAFLNIIKIIITLQDTALSSLKHSLQHQKILLT
jgi:hypothetical protein